MSRIIDGPEVERVARAIARHDLAFRKVESEFAAKRHFGPHPDCSGAECFGAHPGICAADA